LALLYSGNAMTAPGFGLNSAPAAPVDRSVLRRGDEGQDVLTLQERLSALGYFLEAPSGEFDAATVQAVKAFQGENGLKVDGEAGQATQGALYAVGVVSLNTLQEAPLAGISNLSRELTEQQASGAISASLAGGGVAASLHGTIYAVGNGALTATAGGKETRLFAGPARYIHATDKGVTFVSGSDILRVPARGGSAQTLAKAGSIGRLSMIGEMLYYLEGGSLMRADAKGGDAVLLASDVRDFCLDVFEYTAYLATDTGVKRVSLLGDTPEVLLVSTPAAQVQLCDSIIYFLSGGSVYAIVDSVNVLILPDDVEWMAVYRDKLYTLSGGRLYQSDLDGQNTQLFHDEQTAEVSFVAGMAYITANPGGPVTKILPVE